MEQEKKDLYHVLTEYVKIIPRKAEEYVNSTGERYHNLCIETPYEIEFKRGKIKINEVRRNIRRIFKGRTMPKKLKGITREMYKLEFPRENIKRYIEDNYDLLFGCFGEFNPGLKRIIEEVGNSRLKGQEAIKEVDCRFRKYEQKVNEVLSLNQIYFQNGFTF